MLLRRLRSLAYVLEYPELSWLPNEPEKVACVKHLGIPRLCGATTHHDTCCILAGIRLRVLVQGDGKMKTATTMTSRQADSGAMIGYEAELWALADALRGSMDAAEYKHVVLGLIFLKYISDAFEEHHAAVLTEWGENAVEDRDEYIAESIFWVPQEARWALLKARARQASIGQTIDRAMTAIERDNPALKDVLPKDYARPALDKLRLGQLIDMIGNIRVGDAEARSRDVLGSVYEYFLSQFASAEGKRGGEIYTPRCIVRLLVEMLKPYRGRVYDPCCGSSGMFVLANGSMSSSQSGEGEIRKNLVEAELVDCMVALPGQLFYSTQIPACLWFLARGRERRREILFIDARNLGRMVDRTHRELTDEEIARIADTYHGWRAGEEEDGYADVPGFCKSVALDEVRKHGQVLTPGLYVGVEPQEDDGEPFEDRMKRLVSELRDQQAEGARLDAAITENLRALGFGVKRL